VLTRGRFYALFALTSVRCARKRIHKQAGAVCTACAARDNGRGAISEILVTSSKTWAGTNAVERSPAEDCGLDRVDGGDKLFYTTGH